MLRHFAMTLSARIGTLGEFGVKAKTPDQAIRIFSLGVAVCSFKDCDLLVQHAARRARFTEATPIRGPAPMTGSAPGFSAYVETRR